jgi:hypothetical protein
MVMMMVMFIIHSQLAALLQHMIVQLVLSASASAVILHVVVI